MELQRMTVEHHVRFYYPGHFISEESSIKTETRDIRKILEMTQAKGAYGFVLSSRDIAEIDGRLFKSDAYNISGMFYIDGVVFTRDEVMKWDDDEFKVLKANMRNNDWDRVIKINSGWFLPFDEGDCVI